MPTPIFTPIESRPGMSLDQRVDYITLKINILVQELNNILVQLDSVNVKSISADVTPITNDLTGTGTITQNANGFVVNNGTTDTMVVNNNGNITTLAPQNLNPTNTTVPDWTNVTSTGDGVTLQAALDSKLTSAPGVSGTVFVAAVSGGPVTTAITFVNGVRVV